MKSGLYLSWIARLSYQSSTKFLIGLVFSSLDLIQPEY